MSETQGPQLLEQSVKNSDTKSVEVEPKDDEKRTEQTQIESPKETMLENISDKLTEPNRQETVKRLVKSPSSEEPRRQPGECRLLPVLVDLRSSLETNCEPTCTTMSRQNDADLSPITDGTETKLDINYFQDLCTSDLKTAIARLEDTLKRVDLNSLTKYSSTLEPSDKFHLLQLISTLVSNLKKAKIDEDVDELRPSPPPPPLPPALTRRPRKRGNRHTIGVSSEELASARRWLEQERGPAAVKIIPKKIPQALPSSETSTEYSPPAPPPLPDKQRDPRTSDCPWGTISDVNVSPARTCDKQMKDAINQKQSLQHKIKESDSTSINPTSLLSGGADHGTGWKRPADGPLSPQEESLPHNFSYVQPNSRAHQLISEHCKSNKFIAKKSKIKRANTIDIPNYLKMQAEKQKLHSNGAGGLRKPIDISDKVAWNQFCGPQSMNPPPSIPSFQPKTENDRKFLALINRNVDSQSEPWVNIPPSSAPFKSFNYRQTNSVADKNWKSRFSNIKTTFDRQQSTSSSVSSSPASSVFTSGPFVSRRNSKDYQCPRHLEEEPKFHPKHFHKNFEDNGDRVAVASRRFSTSSKGDSTPEQRFFQPVPHKNSVFTHAATSPFKKVPSSPKYDVKHQKVHKAMSPTSEKPVPSSYLPACATSGLLKAKVKMFDHQSQPQSQPQAAPHKPVNNVGHFHQKTFNPIKQVTPIKLRDPPVLKKSNRSNKIAQFYANNSDDFDNNVRNTENHREKEVQIDVQSVAVQTSARPSPKPSTPESEPFAVHNFYKPPATESFYAESENPIYVPPRPKDVNYFEEKYDNYKPAEPQRVSMALNSFIPLSDEHNIENQDITQNKVITRYTAAIGTVASSSPSPSPEPPHIYVPPMPPSPAKPGQPIVLQDDARRHTVPNSLTIKPGQPLVLQDDIQRHNLLQQSLIKRIQSNEEQQVFSSPERSPTMIEINNTQDKISMFEEKSQPVPKINVTSPNSPAPKVAPPSFPVSPKPATMPMDSSDEYLVSCSIRPNRFVLSKSESWHQLALTGGCKPLQHLQVPSHHQTPQHSLKPPKSSSPLQRLSKHFDTGSSQSALKKMEEKVQRYFNNPRGSSGSLDSQQNQPTSLSSTTSSHIKRESKRRSFSPRKMGNSLARSQTMPHVFDDTFDVDKAFDSLFEEATRDNRH